jgi:hypothetical protein
MFHVSRLLVAAALTLAVAAPASAASTLAPLFTVSGVINNGSLATFFSCTNTDTVPTTVGIEIDNGNGTLLNVPSATALSISPKNTVLFGTTAASPLTFAVDANLAPGTVAKGSPQILTTSKKIVCSAIIADPSGNPPQSIGNLTIAAKGRQRGD